MTRSDLSAGYVATQAAHAVGEFCVRRPDAAQDWKEAGGWLITLTAADEPSLTCLADALERAGVCVTRFSEADLDDELTAIACISMPEVCRLTANLPLALGTLSSRRDNAARDRERSLRQRARLVMAGSGGGGA